MGFWREELSRARMDRDTLADRIDHTVLGPTTTPADVDRVLTEATAAGMGCCIPPCHLDRADGHQGRLVTVVGFPHGQHTPEVKATEAREAADNGADELDVVVNVGSALGNDPGVITDELSTVLEAVDVPVKAILETPLLEPDQLRAACDAAVAADVAMLKTATGFATGGATPESVSTLAEYAPVKASGGIRTREDALAMLEAGAERIGTSSGPALLEAD